MAPATRGGNPGSRTGRKRSMRSRRNEMGSRSLGDAQIGADGSQQIRGKNIVDGDEVALFREALKFAEVRLDHGNKFAVPTESESSIDSFQFTEKETYYYITSGWPGLFVTGRWHFGGGRPCSPGKNGAGARQTATLQSSKRDPSLPMVVQDRHPSSGVWLTITDPPPYVFCKCCI